MADPQRPDHQFDRIGQLLFQKRPSAAWPCGGPSVDPAHAEHDAKDDPDHRLGRVKTDSMRKARPRQAHDPDQRLGRKRDIGPLRLLGQNRIKRDAFGIQMLVHLLAELFQHLFAVRVLFQKGQTPAEPVVQADRLAEDRQVDTFDDHHDGDEDQDVD
jgi:hypothetical protein